MRWFVADKDYINYLRTLDKRVPIIDYEGALKPYVGVIIVINEYKYYVSVTSPKSKQLAWKNKLDFIRVEDENGVLIAGINLNNMLPIPSEYLTPLNYSEIQTFRSFGSDEDRLNYLELLRNELKDIRSKKELISINALKLYRSVMNNPDSDLAKRTCDFKLLESVYNKSIK